MYRTLLGILAGFALALLIVGLTFSAAAEAPADYRFINGTEPKSLDPAMITGQPEGRIADALFEGLTRRNTKSLKPEPGTAASWELSADKKTYTFHLRPEAVWTDGRPVTAHDFAWSWRRLQEPALGSEYAYLLHGVRHAEEYNLYAGNARALVGEAKPGERNLADAVGQLASAGQGVEAAAWQALLSAHRAQEHVKGTPDPVLQEALTMTQGRLTAERLTQIERAVRLEGERRRSLHAEAVKRFGIDGGAYARDDRTFVVELEAPTAYFLELTCFYPTYAAPRHVVRPKDTGRALEDEVSDWFMPGKIVSNGPFELASWRVSDKMRLVKSRTYWGRERVRLNIVDVLPTENVTTALNLYLTGAVDWLPSNYPLDLVADLKKRPDYYSSAGSMTYFYRFNCTRRPFDDVRVRKAICLALRREEIVQRITGRGEIPAVRIVSPGMAGYQAPDSVLRTDLAQAQALLAAAGYPQGKGFPEVGILYNTQDGHKKVAEFVAYDLRESLGIKVRAYNQEWQAYQDNVRLLQYDMARAGWIADYPDPNTFLDMWITNGGNNQTGWSDPDYDRLLAATADVESFAASGPETLVARMKEPAQAQALLAALAAATEPGARAEAGGRLRMHLFREAEAILFQDAFPIMPIYHYVTSGLVQPWVKEFYPRLVLPDGSTADNLQDLHPFHEVWIDRELEAREGIR